MWNNMLKCERSGGLFFRLRRAGNPDRVQNAKDQGDDCRISSSAAHKAIITVPTRKFPGVSSTQNTELVHGYHGMRVLHMLDLQLNSACCNVMFFGAILLGALHYLSNQYSIQSQVQTWHDHRTK